MIAVERGEMDETGDSAQCALFLARQGEDVVLGGPGPLSAAHGRSLEVAGVRVEAALPLDGVDEIWWDVWTAETDARVQTARTKGLRMTCLADYVLSAHRKRVVAITGTAGKTTTTSLTAQLLGWLRPVTTSLARAGNLWPNASLLEAPSETPIVLELTSSHLAFCNHSPRIATVTNYWLDHLELHGSEDAYRAAKKRIFARQRAGDMAVLPFDDESASSLAEGSPATRCWFAEGLEPPAARVRAWSMGDSIFLEMGGKSLRLGFPVAFTGVRRRALLAALATTLAAVSGSPGTFLEPLEVALTALKLPPHRSGIDDSLATTPRKARASLFPGAHVVVGGLLSIAGRRVHISDVDVEAWVCELKRLAAGVYLFGPAGEWLSKRLDATLYPDVVSALRAARERGSVLISPGFPMLQSDREAVARLAGDA